MFKNEKKYNLRYIINKSHSDKSCYLKNHNKKLSIDQIDTEYTFEIFSGAFIFFQNDMLSKYRLT